MKISVEIKLGLFHVPSPQTTAAAVPAGARGHVRSFTRLHSWRFVRLTICVFVTREDFQFTKKTPHTNPLPAKPGRGDRRCRDVCQAHLFLGWTITCSPCDFVERMYSVTRSVLASRCPFFSSATIVIELSID